MSQIHLKKKCFISLFIAVMLTGLFACSVFAAFSYEHDPMLNPKAAQDIIVDPDAVYGYSPNPESKRLGPYASYDWTDPDVVAAARAEREAYLKQFEELYALRDSMRADGCSTEEIARALCQRRNEIRMEAVKDDPEELEKQKASNLETYGNENGPTADYLYEKKGSWEAVIEGSFNSNPGMDACLGLYDQNYNTYEIEEAEDPVPVPQQDIPAADTPDSTEGDAMDIDRSPKTGETGNPVVWIALLAIILSGMAAAAASGKNS